MVRPTISACVFIVGAYPHWIVTFQLNRLTSHGASALDAQDEKHMSALNRLKLSQSESTTRTEHQRRIHILNIHFWNNIWQTAGDKLGRQAGKSHRGRSVGKGAVVPSQT